MSYSSDQGRAITATAASFMGVTGLLVWSRIWMRSTTTGLHADDVFVILSWIFTAALCSATIVATQAGLGKHISDVAPEDYISYLKLLITILITWSWGTCLAKCSFAMLYLRLIPNHSIQVLNRCIIVFLICQAIEESLVIVFQCNPVAKAWSPNMDGSCIRIQPMWWAGFGFGLCIDWILFIEPIPFIWKLQLLSTAKKVGLSFMLSLGLLLCIISVKRIVESAKAGTDDNKYLYGEPILWSIAELGALLICSCIPALRQIIYHFAWLNRMLGLSFYATSNRPQYSKSSASAVSRFFFNRRVRYGRSTGGSGLTDGDAGGGSCTTRSNIDNKTKTTTLRPNATEIDTQSYLKRQHLLPPPFWPRPGSGRPMNLRSGIRSNVEVSNHCEVKDRATRSTDHVASRSMSNVSSLDLSQPQNTKKLEFYAEASGIRVWTIEVPDPEASSRLGSEKEPESQPELCRPAPALVRGARSIPPIKITYSLGDSEEIILPGVEESLLKLKRPANQDDSKEL